MDRERKSSQSCKLDVGGSPLWDLQKKKMKGEKKIPKEEVWCVWSARDDRLWKSSFSA